MHLHVHLGLRSLKLWEEHVLCQIVADLVKLKFELKETRQPSVSFMVEKFRQFLVAKCNTLLISEISTGG